MVWEDLCLAAKVLIIVGYGTLLGRKAVMVSHPGGAFPG